MEQVCPPLRFLPVEGQQLSGKRGFIELDGQLNDRSLLDCVHKSPGVGSRRRGNQLGDREIGGQHLEMGLQCPLADIGDRGDAWTDESPLPWNLPARHESARQHRQFVDRRGLGGGRPHLLCEPNERSAIGGDSGYELQDASATQSEYARRGSVLHTGNGGGESAVAPRQRNGHRVGSAESQHSRRELVVQNAGTEHLQSGGFKPADCRKHLRVASVDGPIIFQEPPILGCQGIKWSRRIGIGVVSQVNDRVVRGLCMRSHGANRHAIEPQKRSTTALCANLILRAPQSCLRERLQSAGMRLVVVGKSSRFLRHERHSPVPQPIQRRQTHRVA